MIHGGAGALDNVKSKRERGRSIQSQLQVLAHGREILSRGGGAMEAVETCANLLEDDPLYNAGCGSVLNENGKVEMDAAIMDGRDLTAGAVAGIQNIANPINLARLVHACSEHVLLIGQGALRFAQQWGMKLAPDHYFLTSERIEQLKHAQLSGKVMLDHGDEGPIDEEAQKFGTIGAIARDRFGNLAAATSTGGIVNKRFGRVGDSAVIGAGVFADNRSCAVSCTGFGEDFLRTVQAKTLADMIEFGGLDGATAANRGITYLVDRVQGRGGFILIDTQGSCHARFTTKRMIHGWIERSGESRVGFLPHS